MGKITVEESGAVGAPAELTYSIIADDAHHQRFLPDAFQDFTVLEGGVGAGTRHSFSLHAGRRVRQYTMRVEEPEPGRVITESDEGSSLVTRFVVEPEGTTCRVTITTTWDGAGGIGGFFERTFAPRVMKGLYVEELGKLDAYAREQLQRA